MSDNRDEKLKPLPFTRQVSPARPEAEARWPTFTDPYKAGGAAIDAEIPCLVIVLGRDGFKPGQTAYRVLQYVYLDEGEAGFTADGDQWFSYVFASRAPKRLTVHGRGIFRYADLIGHKRQPWIRLADRDFRAGEARDEEPVITRITLEDWMPEEQ
jgi:hypothetical protein